MRLVIAKVDQVYFDGEAESVTVPAAEGQMTILSNHEPFVTTLGPGTVTVRTSQNNKEEQAFDVLGGVLQIHSGGATIIL